MATPRLAMVYDRAEALAYRRLPDDYRAKCVLALSAAAEAVLHDCGQPVLGTADRLGDRGHSRVVARMRRTDRMVATLLAAETAMDMVAQSSLRHDLHYLGCFAIAAWLLLGREGPWLIPDRDGWTRHIDRRAAHRALLARIAARPESFRDGPRPAWIPGLVVLVNRIAARLLRGHADILLTTTGHGMANFVAEAGRQSPRLGTVELRATRHDLGDLAHPLRGLWRAWRGTGTAVLMAAPCRREAAAEAARRVLDGIPDPVVKAALDLFADKVTAQAALASGLSDEMTRLVRRLNGRAVLAHALRWSSDAALAQAARQVGTPVVLLSHGSHPDPARMAPAAAYSHTVLADGLLTSPFADLVAAQSPHADAAIRSLSPQVRVLRTRPIQWGYKALPPATPGSGGRRRLLHAGTFKPLAGMRPFIFETSGEFVAGLRDLVAAMVGLPDIELVIRMRAGPECSLDDLAALLTLPENVRIKSHRDGSFLEDLAQSHALVSYSSTTIEEALHARRPVVLWGGLHGYHHLPARMTPPTPTDRAAVYAPATAAQLGPMLAAVVGAHDTPLTDSELAGHVWPDAPGIDALLDRLQRRDWS